MSAFVSPRTPPSVALRLPGSPTETATASEPGKDDEVHGLAPVRRVRGQSALLLLEARPRTRPGDPGRLADLPDLADLFQRALQVAGYLIIDTPPLTETTTALRLIADVDAVLLVCRIGRTRRDQVKSAVELLAATADATPVGCVLVGTSR